jgi:hypothetical protein
VLLLEAAGPARRPPLVLPGVRTRSCQRRTSSGWLVWWFTSQWLGCMAVEAQASICWRLAASAMYLLVSTNGTHSAHREAPRTKSACNTDLCLHIQWQLPPCGVLVAAQQSSWAPRCRSIWTGTRLCWTSRGAAAAAAQRAVAAMATLAAAREATCKQGACGNGNAHPSIGSTRQHLQTLLHPAGTPCSGGMSFACCVLATLQRIVLQGRQGRR